ncbi:hypothetical protein M0812_08483 [Anaeramoeba flamelloides]|uniref:DUF1049 domain-containing protein n=1 Tax=Anaeramoeba flamelloides TaxID=1746091 RepID=A0AAV7ZWM5_9EUKA|nr:hypothetical protein M0812_08483 [Anaeramoeba flamelloides]
MSKRSNKGKNKNKNKNKKQNKKYTPQQNKQTDKSTEQIIEEDKKKIKSARKREILVLSISFVLLAIFFFYLWTKQEKVVKWFVYETDNEKERIFSIVIFLGISFFVGYFLSRFIALFVTQKKEK